MGQYKYTFSEQPLREYFKITDLERGVPAFIEEKRIPSITLDEQLDRVRLQIYSKTGTFLEEISEGRIPTGTRSEEGSTFVEVSLNPIQDATSLFYTEGDIQILYQFLRNWYTPGEESELEIKDISADRTEVKCFSPVLSTEVITSRTDQLYSRLEQEEYLPEVSFRFTDG